MKKFDRITAILIHLQSKRQVTAQELAERFKVSLRTIYRDVETLNKAGVPIIGELGVGYSVMEGYRLPPVMFTQEEALSFLIAGKIFEKYGDAQCRKHFQSALFKVKSVLRNADKSVADEMDNKITVIKKTEPNAVVDKNLPLIIRSLIGKETLRVEYRMLVHSDKQTYQIEPLGIVNENGIWITVAFNQETRDYKRFRIERITQLQLCGRPFSTLHPPLEQFLSSKNSNEGIYTPVIKIKKDFAHYIEEQKYLYGLVEEKDAGGHIVMYFRTTCLQTFSRWFLTIADHAQVTEPKALCDLLNETVNCIKNNLSTAAST